MAKEMNYEEAYQRLELAVKRLEQGDLPLEESFKEFSDAMEYYEKCRTILSELEGRVQILLKSDDSLREEPFDE